MARVERSLLLLVPASAAYQVVADVQAYGEFLPGCDSVEVLQERTLEDGVSEVTARVTASARGLRQEFVTVNRCQPFERIQVQLQEGPFDRLDGCWTFKPVGDEGCRVELELEFIAKGLLMKTLSGVLGSVSDRMVDAFAERIQSAS
ncbi:MAG: type II toxin-antitoxin system RatA family toxin [Pseudomonadota bacterium]|nr:type II toxin-antitoxin system RatA family toxin [Pseudomonadota bacterium]MEC8059063.1 type II toxin-antitoxin system RatA family toxin [Pseudomonadota bacterium]